MLQTHGLRQFPAPPDPMRFDRLLPLIVACALFIENMDSTVLSTSLPAIATDLATDPIALKLALTAYLLSLAVFIPVSGWVADRFGARTTFMSAIAVFLLGSIGCAASGSLGMLVATRFVQGMGGAMMVPVGRLVLLRTVPKSELVQALSWLTIPALVGPVVGPPLGGFITTYFHWRWIFLINLPIGRARDPAREALHPGHSRAAAAARLGRLRARRARARARDVRLLDARPPSGAGRGRGCDARARLGRSRRVRRARAPHAPSAARPRLIPARDLSRGRGGRYAVSDRRRRDAVPAAADAAARLRPEPGAVRVAHLRVRRWAPCS